MQLEFYLSLVCTELISKNEYVTHKRTSFANNAILAVYTEY